ncbi:hypothetical protein D3C73_507500 [compost metagenome]
MTKTFEQGRVVTGFRQNLADADRRSLAGGLDEYRQAERLFQFLESGCRVLIDRHRACSRNTGLVEQPLGDIFVERIGGTENAAADKRDARNFGQPLNGTILAMQAMQHRKQDVDLRQLVCRSTFGKCKKTTLAAGDQGKLGAVFRL